MATIAEALAQALQYHKTGQLPQAEQLYRQILEVEPTHAPALHFLGIMAHQLGQHQQALEFLRQAVGLAPWEASFHNNLGLVYQKLGQLEEASASYRQALELRPDYFDAHINLGNALREGGRLDEAITSYRRALRLQPNLAEAHNHLGMALQEQGRLNEAGASYRQALRLRPDLPEVHNNLGNVLREQGQLEEAIACYRQALHLRPDFAEAHNHLGTAYRDRGRLDLAIASFRQALQLRPDLFGACNNLGNTLADLGQLEEAVACYRQALRLRPDYTGSHNNLGNVLRGGGRVDEAIACYQEALRLEPDYAEARQNLGNALKDQGLLDEAIVCYRRALELKPNDAGFHSNLVYALHFSPAYDSQAIYEEHRRWDKLHAEPLARFILPHENERAPNRRLRIGYLSADFREHPIGQFMLPLLEAHDHKNLEVFCYAAVRVPDTMTDRCRAHADVWRPVVGLSAEQLAQAIRQDRIDILVDLTMHMENSRLLVFARKPAPVQVTYLAYCGTTGLTAIDYRLTDPYLDPPGQDERIYSERSIHLPETYWCYRPTIQTPRVNSLPALQAGQITFGCLNNFCKVSQPTLAAWSQLLQALPQAQLLLHAKAGSHRERVRDFLTGQNVAPERLTFLDPVSLGDYFRNYERIDVALDPFPYGGGTTTCDALWMGVPVVSLAGQTAVGRAGLSILSNVGLADLVAGNAEEYVRRALALGNDLPRLSEMRATLRERMQASPLMDAPRFARNVEAAYRKMWQSWCMAQL